MYMTNSQKQKIEWVKKQVEDMAKTYHKDGEVKELTFEETDYDAVICQFTVGGVGDEDNAVAKIFCRERGHFFIGKRGGITYYSHNEPGCKSYSLSRFSGLDTIARAQAWY